MARLQVSYEELTTAARTFEAQATVISEALSTVQNQVNNIQTYWESTTETAFLDEWNMTYPKFQRLCEMLKEHGTALSNTVTTLQEAETTAAAGIRSTVVSNDA